MSLTIVLTLLLPAQPARALGEATLTVNTTTDVVNANDGKCSLREALQRLPDYGGVITLEIRPRYSDHLDEALQAARQLVASV